MTEKFPQLRFEEKVWLNELRKEEDHKIRQANIKTTYVKNIINILKIM